MQAEGRPSHQKQQRQPSLAQQMQRQLRAGMLTWRIVLPSRHCTSQQTALSTAPQPFKTGSADAAGVTTWVPSAGVSIIGPCRNVEEVVAAQQEVESSLEHLFPACEATAAMLGDGYECLVEELSADTQSLIAQLPGPQGVFEQECSTRKQLHQVWGDWGVLVEELLADMSAACAPLDLTQEEQGLIQGAQLQLLTQAESVQQHLAAVLSAPFVTSAARVAQSRVEKQRGNAAAASSLRAEYVADGHDVCAMSSLSVHMHGADVARLRSDMLAGEGRPGSEYEVSLAWLQADNRTPSNRAREADTLPQTVGQQFSPEGRKVLAGLPQRVAAFEPAAQQALRAAGLEEVLDSMGLWEDRCKLLAASLFLDHLNKHDRQMYKEVHVRAYHYRKRCTGT